MGLKVGLTFDLRDDYLAEGMTLEETAEFDKAETIEAIENALSELGFISERIGNVKRLVSRLNAGDRWDLVFNIAEGLYGFGREAQVPALLDAYMIPYTFSDPLVLALTLHKGMTKRVLRDLHVPTPDFAIVEKIEDIDQVNIPCPLFAKPIAEGTGKGVNASSKITSITELKEICVELLQVFGQPVLVEAFLPGREFTVGIVGEGLNARVVGVMEVLLNEKAEHDVYSHINKEYYEDKVYYRLVSDAEGNLAAETALAAWRGLGCRDAGRIDIRSDEQGKPMFIEVNPLAGINPHHSDFPILCRLAGISYLELIGLIMKSAIKRLPGTLTDGYAARLESFTATALNKMLPLV